MTRKPSAKRMIWAAVALLLVLVAAFVWIWTQSAIETPDKAANGQSAKLTADQQTPHAAESLQQDDAAASEKAPSPAPAPESDANPYLFKNWEEMADTLAEMMGKEFDIMRKEQGSDILDIQIASDAYHKVFESIMEKNENPQLRDAVVNFLPFASESPYEDGENGTMPRKENNPLRYLVRAGRLSPLILKNKLTLPNGETYYSDPKEDVVIVWQRESPPGNFRALDRFKKALADLEKRLAQTPDNKQMQQKAADLRAAIETLKKPKLTRYEMFSFGGDDPTHPDHKITFLDLGVIK